MAISIGSDAWRGLANKAASRIASASAEGSTPSIAFQRTASSDTETTDILFWVSVPVLSVQSTVVEPSVSIAAARRVNTLAREMRQAPIAMNTAVTSGN